MRGFSGLAPNRLRERRANSLTAWVRWISVRTQARAQLFLRWSVGSAIKEEGWFGAMSSTKTVFTTGEAAKICKVSQQTIIRCFDNGTLKGFRVPGSRFRRIPRDQLFSFMKDNGIPTDALEDGKKKLLIVDDDQDLVELMQDALSATVALKSVRPTMVSRAGMGVKEFRPDIVVLDVMLPDINGKEVAIASAATRRSTLSRSSAFPV